MPLQMIEARASVLMEFIVDKLMLLDYPNEFCNRRKPPWPPLHKFYFSMPCSSRNEQFSYFVNLVSWLLSLNGRKISIPQEAIDSSAVCTAVMHHLKELGFAQPSWPPAKLKQGFGDAVCSVLDCLTDLALQAQGFRFKDPVYNHDENRQGHAVFDATTDDCVKGSDGKDWRTHFSEAEELYSEMAPGISACCQQLQRIEDDISFFLEKLESRETFLNKQFDLLVSDYSAVNSRFLEVQERCDQKLGSIASLTQQLENTSYLLDEVKQKLVDKGNQISDISPLVEIKNGIHTLKEEIKEMKVHVGVLEHTLLKNQAAHNTAMKSSRDIISVDLCTALP